MMILLYLLVILLSSVGIVAEENGTTTEKKALTSSQLCFTEETLPTCDIPAELTGAYNAQEWCYTLVNEGYVYPVNEMYSEAGFTWHAETLLTVPADSELCEATKEVYHQCYWCTPFITDNYCSQAPVCYPYRPVLPDNIDLPKVCETFKELKYIKKQEPITMELCNLRELVSHQCLDVCYNIDPATSCFSPDKPPSCDSNVFAASGKTIDVQKTCASLEWFFQQENYDLYNTSTHGAALASLHQDSDLCHAAKAAYSQCYWCAPDFSETYCTTLDCLFTKNETSSEMLEDVDVNTLCKEWTDLFAKGSAPKTIDECEQYRKIGPLCPDLECGRFNYDPADACFDDGENSPSCISASDSEDVSFLQETCSRLASEYLFDVDPLNVSMHGSALSRIHRNDSFCGDARRAYPHCHWCAENEVVRACIWPDDCFQYKPPFFQDSSIDVNSTCEELMAIKNNGGKPNSTDMCNKLAHVAHLCPDICGKYDYNPVKACFTEANPPSCIAPNDGQKVEGLYAQEICSRILLEYLQPSGTTTNLQDHLAILAMIPENSDLCSASHEVYHLCYWCSPDMSDQYCQYNEFMPYCSQPPPMLREILAPNEELCNDLTATAGKAQLATIELCDGFQAKGHLCPDLCWHYPAYYDLHAAAINLSVPLCFNETNLPTCNPPIDALSYDQMDEMDIQHKCYLIYSAYWNDLQALSYSDVLPKIRADDTELCNAAKEVFHLCSWCVPNVRSSFCWVYPTCLSDDNITMKNGNYNETVVPACNRIQAVREANEYAASAKMCMDLDVYLPLCHNECTNIDPEMSCFDKDHQPSCTKPAGQDDDSIPYDVVQTTCSILLEDYLDYFGVIFELEAHAKALSIIHREAEFCDAARQVYHMCYWCDPEIVNSTDRYCIINCTGETDVFDQDIDINQACRELATAQDAAQYPASTYLCNLAQKVGALCPGFCSFVKQPFTAVDNPKSMVWLSRVASMLSFLGATFILRDVVSNKKNRQGVYHQLLGAMAIFDIVTAVAWMFARAPIPEKSSFYVDGARGTDATCTAQAFFIQLGFTSVLYNVSLAAYYVLVIVCGWREAELRRIRLLLHGGPLIVGCGLAFAGIPFYDWYVYGCHLRPPPFGELWIVMVFAVLPLGFSVLAITFSMAAVYYMVRRNARKSRKWSFGVGKKSLESKVFWQALLYTLSFYITWPILFSVYIASTDYTEGYDKGKYALPAIVSFVAPLQGFSNFLVYARPFLTVSFQKHTKLFESAVERLRSSVKITSASAVNTGLYGYDMTTNRDDETEQDPTTTMIDPSAAIALMPHPSSVAEQTPIVMEDDALDAAFVIGRHNSAAEKLQ